MQPQGLEALMQSQPVPQMNNPRLAAAMDVVTSDAEEQILDPRTLAMLKYKDALQAMQAADQMMASAQPAPTAPTVAERTRLAAEQGIAGLAQRLSPGVQQRGGQMAAQQAQQMMSGGLPQLSAPNMAGMAGGGIVAFAGKDGSVVEAYPSRNGVAQRPTPTLPYPVPGREDFGAAYEEAAARRESAQRAVGSPPVSKGMTDAEIELLSAAGGIRDGLGSLVPRGLSDEEIAAETTVTRGPSPRETGSMSDEEIAAFLETPRSYGGQLLIDAAQYAKDNPVEAAGLALMTASGVGAVGAGLSATGRSLLARYGPKVVGALRAFVSKPNPAFMVGPQPLGTAARVFSPGRTGASLYAGDKLLDYLQSSESEPPAEEGVPTGAPTTPVPADTTARATPSGATTMPGGVANAARAQPDLNVGIASPSTVPTAAAPAAAPTNTAESQLRARVEGTVGSTDAGSRYRELTGMEDAIKERRVEQDRLRALQEARFSPEQERSRLLRAGLAGLASRGFGGFSSGIAGEEEVIAGERDTAQQRVVADMDKTISELRALGIGQFEAEQAAAEIHSNELRALAALDQDAARLKQDMDIENLRADLIREGYDAEASQALAAAVNEAAVRNSMTPQQVLTIAQRIVADDLTRTKTLAAAVQEVRDVAAGVDTAGTGQLSNMSNEDLLNMVRQ